MWCVHWCDLVRIFADNNDIFSIEWINPASRWKKDDDHNHYLCNGIFPNNKNIAIYLRMTEHSFNWEKKEEIDKLRLFNFACKCSCRKVVYMWIIIEWNEWKFPFHFLQFAGRCGREKLRMKSQFDLHRVERIKPDNSRWIARTLTGQRFICWWPVYNCITTYGRREAHQSIDECVMSSVRRWTLCISSCLGSNCRNSVSCLSHWPENRISNIHPQWPYVFFFLHFVWLLTWIELTISVAVYTHTTDILHFPNDYRSKFSKSNIRHGNIRHYEQSKPNIFKLTIKCAVL